MLCVYANVVVTKMIQTPVPLLCSYVYVLQGHIYKNKRPTDHIAHMRNNRYDKIQTNG